MCSSSRCGFQQGLTNLDLFFHIVAELNSSVSLQKVGPESGNL